MHKRDWERRTRGEERRIKYWECIREIEKEEQEVEKEG